MAPIVGRTQPACGSTTGYSRHLARDERPCDDCRAARNAWRAVSVEACKWGHPYDEANTYWYVPEQGRARRNCRACGRAVAARIAAQREGKR